ncbi:MAG: hypothetical protein Q9165_007359 [Trypethelium subeluteriae]
MAETPAADLPHPSATQRNKLSLFESADFSLRPSRQDSQSQSDSDIVGDLFGGVDNINSTFDFLIYLSILPQHLLSNLSSLQDIAHDLFIGSEINYRFVGDGLSFSVHSITRPELSQKVLDVAPSLKNDGPELIAIKMPRAENNNGSIDKASEIKALRAVAWECHVLLHPPIQASNHVIRFLGVLWQAGGGADSEKWMLPAIAMEYANAGTLDDLIDSEEYTITYQVKKNLILDVARGLNALHKSYFIHGDVKTENCGELCLNGKTPLDAGRRQYVEKGGPFQSILDHDRQSEGFIQCVQDLKCSTDDMFLEYVKSTLPENGIDILFISDLLSQSLRKDPRDRAHGLAFIDHFIRLDQGETTYQAMAEQTTPDVKYPWREEPTTLQVSPSTNRFLDTDLVLFSWSDIAKELPIDVKHQLAEDFREVATDERLGESVRGQGALNFALSILLSFHKDASYSEGLKWLIRAAELGCIQAQALAYRLLKAFDVKPPPGLPLVTWLSASASQGVTRIALEDLMIADRLSYSQVLDNRSHRTQLSVGDSDWIFKDEIKEYVDLDDPEFFKEQLSNLLNSPDNAYKTINDVKLEYGVTLMHLAACFNCVDIMRVCCAFGAGINSRAPISGETPIISACRLGHVKATEFLINSDADLSFVDMQGANTLHYLSRFPDETVVDLVSTMVRKGADPNQQAFSLDASTTFIGEYLREYATALNWAVLHGKPKLCAALVDNGADPFRADHSFKDMGYHESLTMQQLQKSDIDPIYDTPFASAVSQHQPDIIEVFLNHHGTCSSPHEIDFAMCRSLAIGQPKLAIMCLNGYKFRDNLIRTLRFLQSADSIFELMDIAINRDDEVLVKALLDQEFPLDCKIDGLTPLCMSCLRPNGNITLDLLHHGADPCQRSSIHPCAPLILLAYRSEGARTLDVAQQMINRGATYGNDPASYAYLYFRAILEQWDDVADLLLRHGLLKEIIDDQIFESLLRQNDNRSLLRLRTLLAIQRKHGATDPIILQAEKRSVYHHLVSFPEEVRDDRVNLKALKLLLGVYPSTSLLDHYDRHGWTALALSVCEGNHFAVEALLEAGADPMTGHGAALHRALDRLLHPKSFSGGFRGLSNRHRKSQRYEENSLRVVMVFLKHSYPGRIFHAKSFSVIKRSLARWRSEDFILSGLTKGLAREERDSGNSVSLSINELNGIYSPYIMDSRGHLLRDLEASEFFHGMSTNSGNAFGRQLTDSRK